MANWYVKQFAKMTGVSVRTLHHYDQIDLLQPSIRSDAGYRLYSEDDLLVLQQIMALKFFGFKLAEIKQLLRQKTDVLQHFQAQTSLLQQKANAFLRAKTTLDKIIENYQRQQTIKWQDVIKSIEVYKMAQDLKNKWVADALDTEELHKYAEFEKQLQQRFSKEAAANSEQQWKDLIAAVKQNLDKDPTGAIGFALAETCMNWVNKLYGKENAALRKAIWEKGFKENRHDNSHGMSPQIVEWLDTAISSYYRNRAYAILAKVGKEEDSKVLQQFNGLLEEMHGVEKQHNQETLQMAMEDNNISTTAKKWLKLHFNIK